MFFNRFRVCVSVAAGLCAAGAHAANTQQHEHAHQHPVPEIFVTADPLGAVDSHFVAPTTIITGDELNAQSMRSIGEAVANQLGVTSADFGASVGRPVIRGLGGGRVRVLEDGIGTLDVSTISADHGVTVEPIFAQQIEILRGPATLLYGSGASGGLVNVVNDRIATSLPEKLEANFYSHYDSASEGWLGAFKFNGAINDSLVLHFDGSMRETSDVDIPGYASVSPDEDEVRGTLSNSFSDGDNFAVGMSFIADRGFIGVSLASLATRYGLPGVHGHEEEHGHDDDDDNHDEEEHDEAEEGGASIDLEQVRLDLKGAWVVEFGLLHELKTRWAFNDYEHDEVEGNGEVGTRFANDAYEGRVEAIIEPMGRWDGAIGMQFSGRDFSALGEEAFVAPAETDSWAIFVFEKGDFNDIHLDLGVRYEHVESERQPQATKASFDLFSASLGILYSGIEANELGLSVGHSERAPGIEELFAAGPHLATNTFEFGDLNLSKESSYNIDLFWRRQGERMSFDFTVFYNHIQDFIFLQPSDLNNDGIADRVEDEFAETREIVDELDALALVFQNQSDADFWGFELATDFHLLRGPGMQLNWRIWTDFVDAELSGGGNVPRLPPLRYGTTLSGNWRDISAQLRLTHTTSTDDLAALETATDGFTMFDVHASWATQFGSVPVELFARGTNLLNHTARRHTSFVKDLAPLPGRSGLVGIRMVY